MKPATFLAAALVAALGLPAAAAAEEGPVFVPTLKKAFVLSKERGAPILVWVSGDQDADEKTDLENIRNKDALKGMAGFLVVFVSPPDVSHGSRDGTIDGKPAKVCSYVPSITCADHKNAWSEVFGAYGDAMADKGGMAKVPNHFVVGPDGKVVGSVNNGTLAGGFSAVTPPNLVRGLKDMMNKAGGPGLTDAQYAELQKTLAAARTLVEAGRLKEAAGVLKPFTEIRKNIGIVQDARDLLKKVDKEASTALAKAKSLLAEKPVAGLAALEQVAADYPGTESAGVAAKAVEDYRGSPEGKKALADLVRDKQGRGELQKALESVGKDDGRALKALDAVARKYAGLPSGDEAAAKAAAMRGDPDLVKRVQAAEDERAARAALTQARGLLDAGKKADAAAALKTIVEKYAATDAGKEAAKLLEGLR